MEKKLNFSVVDTQRPYNFDYEENTNTKGYVAWGPGNRFPLDIRKLYLESVTVRSIIDGTVKYICGNGVVCNEGAAKWESKVNRRGEKLNDIIEQVATDLMIYNGFAIQVIYNKIGTIAEMYALDFGRCRSNVNNTKIYYAPKWGAYTAKYEEYDAFNREKIDPEKPTQIFFYKGAARTVYPMPSWLGCAKDAMTEIEAAKLQLNSMANGLNTKVMITLPNDTGTLTDEEKEEVEEAIKTKFCGSEATSSFFLFWREEGMSEMKVDPIHSEDESDKFTTIKKSARENIFVAFRAAPILFGLTSEMSTGFSTQEFKDQFNLYQKTQVKPLQEKITSVLDTIVGADNAIKILPFDIDTEEE